jgi:hypothetical protein
MTSVFRQNPGDGEMWIEAFEAKYEGKGKRFGRAELGFFVGALHGTVFGSRFISFRDCILCGLVRGTLSLGFERWLNGRGRKGLTWATGSDGFTRELLLRRASHRLP